jgi:hypothetical protein
MFFISDTSLTERPFPFISLGLGLSWIFWKSGAAAGGSFLQVNSNSQVIEVLGNDL